jgi:hypothetical protein
MVWNDWKTGQLNDRNLATIGFSVENKNYSRHNQRTVAQLRNGEADSSFAVSSALADSHQCDAQ